MIIKVNKICPAELSPHGSMGDIYLGTFYQTGYVPDPYQNKPEKVSVSFKYGKRRRLIKGNLRCWMDSNCNVGVYYEYYFSPSNPYQQDKLNQVLLKNGAIRHPGGWWFFPYGD